MSVDPTATVDPPPPPLEVADSPLVDRLAPSPNHGPRIGGPPDMVILHYTGMPASEGAPMAERAIRWLCDPRSSVSAHYVVDVDGTVTQLVAESRRAWHAGVSSWRGETDLNSRSVGIEIAHAGHPWDGIYPDTGTPIPHPGYLDFPEPQIVAVERLVRDIVARRAIPPERVLGHSDIAPDRKRDPGEKFPWARLAALGLGLPVAPAPIVAGPVLAPGDAGAEVAALQARLAAVGYGLAVSGVYDPATERTVTAFQMHFRPALIDGRADPSTLATLARLVDGPRGGTPIA